MIDVIIPVYNSKNTLFKALASIALQSIKYRVIVHIIDDCSDYSYLDIISKFECDLNIKFYRLDKNSGPGVARQYGIDNSFGEFICFLDSDDVFYNSKSLEILYDEINMNCDYVIGKVYDEKDNSMKYTLSDLHGKLYRREFILKNDIKFPNSYVHEDNLFHNLVRVCCRKTGIVKDVVYVYCINDNSITSVTGDLEFDRLAILIEHTNFVIRWAVNRNCDIGLIKQYIYEKSNYFNRYYHSVSDDRKIILKKLIDNSLLDSNYLFEDDINKLKESIFNEDISKYISKLS